MTTPTRRTDPLTAAAVTIRAAVKTAAAAGTIPTKPLYRVIPNRGTHTLDIDVEHPPNNPTEQHNLTRTLTRIANTALEDAGSPCTATARIFQPRTAELEWTSEECGLHIGAAPHTFRRYEIDGYAPRRIRTLGRTAVYDGEEVQRWHAARTGPGWHGSRSNPEADPRP